MDSAAVVERDDIMVVEASLVPELRATADQEAGNADAHADQEQRARILARGGNHSAIMNARERMIARRTPIAPADNDSIDVRDQTGPEAADVATSAVAAASESTDTAPIVTDETGATDHASTPVEAPIRSSAFRRVPGLNRARQEPVGSDVAATAADGQNGDDQDIFNSIPTIDPAIELPLQAASESSEQESEANNEPLVAGEQVTVYDAVLERARAIRTAAGKETFAPSAQDHVRAEEIAREEKKTRRRITSVPLTGRPSSPQQTAPQVQTRFQQPVAPVETTPVSSSNTAGSDDAAPRPRTFAELRRQQGDVVPDMSPPVRPSSSPAPQTTSPRMGIAIAALKARELPTSGPELAQQAAERTPNVPSVPKIDFRRAPVETPVIAPDSEPALREIGAQSDRVDVDRTEEEVDYREDVAFAHSEQDVDGYPSIEEPFEGAKRGPFGRFRNPWRKDRDAIRGQQIMASVRDAIGDSDEPWDDPFADVYADDEFADHIEFEQGPARSQRATPAEPSSVVANDDHDEKRIASAVQPSHRQDESLNQARTVREPAPVQQPAAPTRSHGLYRPVHEEAFRPHDEAPSPSNQRRPSYSGRPDRDDRGNGATVLRVRADRYDDGDDELLVAPQRGSSRGEAEFLPPELRQGPERIEDDFRTFDAESSRSYPIFDEVEPEPQLQAVEPSMTPSEARLWSFAPPVDLESMEGMSAFRGRLFGEGGFSPQRTAVERRADDDVVLEVPLRTETSPDRSRSPMQPAKSPLRSSNYRAPEGQQPRQQPVSGGPTQRQTSSAAPQESPRSGASRPAPYRETPRTHVADDRSQSDLAPSEFDIRNLLASTNEPLILGPTIAPDVDRVCRTCRDFRPSENGESGFCANTWAFSHRQMVNANDLPCQSTIGCWWLPSDRVWMPGDRAESATNRVDAMLPEPESRRSG